MTKNARSVGKTARALTLLNSINRLSSFQQDDTVFISTSSRRLFPASLFISSLSRDENPFSIFVYICDVHSLLS